MGRQDIPTLIDIEIKALKQARAMLEGRLRQRPEKEELPTRSPRRIVEAVKRRWALAEKNIAMMRSAGEHARGPRHAILASQ